jgi:hypothetical protein
VFLCTEWRIIGGCETRLCVDHPSDHMVKRLGDRLQKTVAVYSSDTVCGRDNVLLTFKVCRSVCLSVCLSVIQAATTGLQNINGAPTL